MNNIIINNLELTAVKWANNALIVECKDIPTGHLKSYTKPLNGLYHSNLEDNIIEVMKYGNKA